MHYVKKIFVGSFLFENGIVSEKFKVIRLHLIITITKIRVKISSEQTFLKQFFFHTGFSLTFKILLFRIKTAQNFAQSQPVSERHKHELLSNGDRRDPVLAWERLS